MIATIAKSIVAGASTLATGIGTAIASGDGITGLQWAVLACGVIIAAGTVWAVTNAPAPLGDKTAGSTEGSAHE
jgi:hypothetical protein